MVKSSANIDPLSGVIFVSRGHSNITNQASKLYGATLKIPPDLQGFINERGEFLTREEAYIEAVNCKQIEFDEHHHGGQILFSEDIWSTISPEFYVLPATEKTLLISKEYLYKHGREFFIK